MHEACPPLRDGKHDAPSRDSDGLFGSDGGLDLMELLLDPVLVGAVIMQLPQHTHCLFLAVNLHEVPGRLWEKHDAADEHEGRGCLKRERKPPLEWAQGPLSMR